MTVAIRIALLVCCCLGYDIHAQTIGTFFSGGIPMSYRTFGSGKPLLIINGGPGLDSDGFVWLAEKLSAQHQTILYDQRGTGKSVLPVADASTVTMDLMVKDLECLRKHLNIRQWVVLGHSFGGVLASYYVARHPDKVERLVLSSSGGVDLTFLSTVGRQVQANLTPAERDSLAFWTHRMNTTDSSAEVRLHRAMFLAPAYVVNRAYIPVLAERLAKVNYTINQLIINDLSKIGYDCAARLKRYRGPVLVLHGRRDVLLPEIAEKSAASFSHATLVWMDNTAHYGWLDNPEVFFGALEAFLQTK